VKHRIIYFLQLFLFWTVFFVLSRWVFLIFYLEQSAGLTLLDFIKISGYGLRLDFSMAGYLMVISTLILIASVMLPNRITYRSLLVLNSLFIIASILIIVIDLETYRHWGFRLDASPLLYLKPESLASTSAIRLSLLIMLAIFIGGSAIWVVRSLHQRIFAFHAIRVKNAFSLLLLLPALFLPIRGSLGVAPISTGAVYFHRTNIFPNHAGINVVWNFLRSVIYLDQSRYTEKIADTKTASSAQQQFVFKPDSTIQVLRATHPNVLLIIVESFTSKIIEPLGGLKNITPELNQLCQEGLLFEDIYASGDRTDRGLVSLLSGYPAQTRTSIIKYPSKTQSLPYWSAKMLNIGYHTSFVYGGDIGFANMESYLITSRFQHITRDFDFNPMISRSKWGVHDEFLFNQLTAECDTAQFPFFKVALTLSSHEPFDVPFGKINRSESDEKLFLNACKYTDSVLGNFIRNAKNTEWWKNTLIIITADHGHAFPGNHDLMNRDRFKIPVLWLGGALETQPKRISKIGSQTDLVNTFFNQTSGFDPDFTFSKDLLAPETPDVAVFTFNNGFGYADRYANFIWDITLSDYLNKEGNFKAAEPLGKGYVQAIFNDYNSR
jgi:phosphoglycerol transferase MdoB-like AlkP superfamily enzyme